MTAPFRIVAVSAFALAALPASAATFFFTDTPYLSSADIPFDFYASGSADFLEDFEDRTIDDGITVASTVVQVLARTAAEGGDSVEYPGTGGVGTSLRTAAVTFSFSSPVTAAGLVWTDGFGDYRFEAFNAENVSLGSITKSLGVAASFIGDGGNEDRFFGVTSLGGIGSISMTLVGNAASQMEFDHIQYGRAFVPPPNDPTPPTGPQPSVVPLPAGLPLLLAGLGVLGLMRRAERG